MSDQQFTFEYIPGTGEILLHASYPAGHQHTTSFHPDEVEVLMQSGMDALKKYRA